MPADNSLSQAPSKNHSNGNLPYQCSTQPVPPGPRNAEWAIEYGYCRTSLDHQPPHYRQGSTDPRCPRDCPHKAPQAVAQKFTSMFLLKGARKAAEWTMNHKADKTPK